MGPHNVNRPQSRTITFTDDTLVQPPPSPAAQARDAFNRTFGPMPAVQNPFTGMSQAPTAPVRPPQNPTDGLGNIGTGIGLRNTGRIVGEPIHTFSMMNPVERSTFFNRNRRTDLAHLSHGTTHQSPTSVAQLHPRATHAPTVRPDPNRIVESPVRSPIHGRVTATAGRNPQIRPQPSVHMQHIGTTLEYAPQGTQRHTAVADIYRTDITPTPARTPAPIQHAPRNVRPEALPRNPEQRVQTLLARARTLVSEGNRDRQSGAYQRAYNQYNQAQQLFQQATRISGRHSVSGETMMDLGFTGIQIHQSIQGLPNGSYAPIIDI